ncbi:MarP family serine protease [Natronosporangium hydrolyticum]|uniref:MarP family serine protease n=1 Tax=Natronosporangium hydrolyticum TaxID=2811111 RepID=A0A895YL04_9ACTN|nr:MarP family serine protease [Natronosporangium hydrolyticum]QSB14538.1 MarP family serine protease [Natronosporangium hydrolyticum]
MSVVDVVLVVLMLMFAISGYRQGFVVGILSFAGFFAGALLGLQLGPIFARQMEADIHRVVVALLAVFGLAVLGQVLAGWLGSRLRGIIRSRPGQKLDDAGGAVVSLVAVALVAWLVAVPLASSSVPWLAKSVRDSAVLGGIDRLMPPPAQALSNALRDAVDTRGFPDVFGGLTPTRVREVAPPDSALAVHPVVGQAAESVVKVVGSAPSCSRRIEGSGFVYSAEYVMTNAHVVAGTRSVGVELAGQPYDATVVVYDPDRDLAVLHVPGLGAPVLPFTEVQFDNGDDAIVLGFPLDGPFDAQEARIRDVRTIRGPDIYDAAQVSREVYTIRALVRSGNSGGPLVSPTGEVIGVIFAAAADDPNTGFAVTADEASTVAEAGLERTSQVDTGACT